MQIKTAKALFAAENIDLEAAACFDGAQWEPYQVLFLNNSTRFGIDVKARQIGWSFTAALDAVVDGILEPGTPHIFVSINLDEAKEKIRYCRTIIDAMRPDMRPRLVQDSQTGLELANGSRYVSHPCRPPRGKARARIYLDEMAHYREGLDREIYTAALPATTKGDGYIRVGSSPLGASGLFWEIVTQSLRNYPGYNGHRRLVPWWHVGALCKDVPRALQIAPGLATEDRVRAFGTQSLLEIFENMFLEDFQQEYECAWVDETVAWISWQIIRRNQDQDLVWWHAKSVDQALAMIPDILEAIEAKQIEQVMVGGLDVGRKRDLTELMLLGKGTTGQLPIRFSVSLDRVEFDDQKRCVEQIIMRLPVSQVLIDQNGIGMQLAEDLGKATGKAQGVDFTNATKELWAVEAKVQAERGNTPLPTDRDIAYQIHSIKKRITAAKNNAFDCERNEKHHADKFWSWALGVWAGSNAPVQQVAVAHGNLYGSRSRVVGNIKRGRRGR